MNIQAAFYDSTLQDTYEAEYARFLQNVVFYDSPKPALPLRMPELGLTLSSSDSLAYSAYYGFITGFFGNLHESFNLSISEFDDQFDSFEEFADYRDSYSYGGKPTRIKLGTIDGLIECSGYAYFPMDRDENGNILPEMTNCSILLYKVESGPVPHTVSVSITSEKRNIEKNIDRTYAALGRMFKQEVDISSIPNPARQITVYSDIADQSIEYNSRIAWLVDHGLLPKKSMLLPMQAVTWGEFLDMYVRFMYGVEYSEEAAKCTPGDYGCRFATIDLATLYPERKPDEGNAKKTLQDVFASLEIEYNQPVEAYFDSSLEQVLLLEIAGVDTSKISFQDMWDLWNETEQSAEFNIRIQEVENAIYRGERVSSYQVFSGYATYTTNCYLYQNSAGLIRKDCSGNTNKVRFNATESARKSLSAVDAYKTRISIIDSPVCTMGSAEYSTDSCLAALNENEKKRLEETVEYMDAHWILSRAGAIDWFLDRMDFSLFDESLAKNKNTDLETEEIEEAKESEEEAANG
ncbi:MAG TPA: hypothetical protein PK765_03955 [bacterium]|nr:hypothetical protein [bacterium]